MALRVVYETGRTGFEDSKELHVPKDGVLAGRFKVHQHVDTAAFSSAIAAYDLLNQRDVCLKIVKNNKDYFDQSLDEIKLLRYLNTRGNPDEVNILRMYEFFYYKEHLIIVSELLKDNLYEVQRSFSKAGWPSFFTMGRIQRLLKSMLVSLQFVHSQNIIHCDLKPENVLISSYSNCRAKVIDFGSSCFTTDTLATYIQSRSYRAPEVILGTPYGPNIDIWSVGPIAYEMATSLVMFPNDSVQRLLARVQSVCGPIPAHMLQNGRYVHKYFTANGEVFEDDVEAGEVVLLLPFQDITLDSMLAPLECPPFVDFVRYLMQIDPAHRPSAAEALKHPFFKEKFDYEPFIFPQTDAEVDAMHAAMVASPPPECMEIPIDVQLVRDDEWPGAAPRHAHAGMDDEDVDADLDDDEYYSDEN